MIIGGPNYIVIFISRPFVSHQTAFQWFAALLVHIKVVPNVSEQNNLISMYQWAQELCWDLFVYFQEIYIVEEFVCTFCRETHQLPCKYSLQAYRLTVVLQWQTGWSVLFPMKHRNHFSNQFHLHGFLRCHYNSHSFCRGALSPPDNLALNYRLSEHQIAA